MGSDSRSEGALLSEPPFPRLANAVLRFLPHAAEREARNLQNLFPFPLLLEVQEKTLAEDEGFKMVQSWKSPVTTAVMV